MTATTGPSDIARQYSDHGARISDDARPNRPAPQALRPDSTRGSAAPDAPGRMDRERQVIRPGGVAQHEGPFGPPLKVGLDGIVNAFEYAGRRNASQQPPRR